MSLDSLSLIALLLVTVIVAYFVIKRITQSPKAEVLEDVEKVSETPDALDIPDDEEEENKNGTEKSD
jgi:sugar phosphate permease